MPNLYRTVALSDHPAARLARKAYWGLKSVTLPAPRIIVKPMLWTFLAVRWVSHFAKRLLICEPLFKAYCKRYGHGVRTGVFVHWVQGKGDIILGDYVELDGKSSFLFGARFSPNPTLRIGDHTIIRGDTSIIVGKAVTIGKHCMIASGTLIFDSSGHPSDPEGRLAGLPPRPEDVRPITVGDNVWICQRSIITPGVTIGEGSIVSAASVVVTDVPAYTVVAGYPARKIASLRNPHVQGASPQPLEAVASSAPG